MDIAARNSGDSRGGNIAFPVCQPDNQCTYEEINKKSRFFGTFCLFLFHENHFTAGNKKFHHHKVFARLLLKFRSSLFKGLRVQMAEPLSCSAEREISCRRFLFDSFFFCACICKRKSGTGFSFLLWLLTGFGVLLFI